MWPEAQKLFYFLAALTFGNPAGLSVIHLAARCTAGSRGRGAPHLRGGRRTRGARWVSRQGVTQVVFKDSEIRILDADGTTLHALLRDAMLSRLGVGGVDFSLGAGGATA